MSNTFQAGPENDEGGAEDAGAGAAAEAPTAGGKRRGGGGGGGRRKGGKEGGEGELEEYDGRMVWVKADSTAQTIGRSITGAAMEDARKGFPVYVFSKYDKNSNTAIKGVVTAQRVLKDRYTMAIGVYPSFRGNRNELTLKVAPLSMGEQPPHIADPSVLDRCQTLSVAAGTDPKGLAGAIAGQARTGAVLCVQAIGAKAVFEMLRAVGVARAYLDDDGKGQDLVCFPDFIEVRRRRGGIGRAACVAACVQFEFCVLAFACLCLALLVPPSIPLFLSLSLILF